MTIPSVFVIESLSFRDERRHRRDGKLLTRILKLAGKKSKYCHIRTKKELKPVLRQFRRSKLRYLHLSCHGSRNSFWFTLDRIPIKEFCKLVRPFLQDRRLFISACNVTNKKLARLLLPDSGCYSLVGPVGEISFADSATFLPSFYHLVFKENPAAMKREAIKGTLQRLCDAFGISMRYFSTASRRPYFSEVVFRPNASPRRLP